MQDENKSVNHARAERIIELMPTLDNRYAALCRVLERIQAGEAVTDSELWLAHVDLDGVIRVMTGDVLQDDEDDD